MMKVAELRNTVSKHTKEQLELLVVELYRAMPKSLKDEKNVDELVRDPDAARAGGAGASRKSAPDFDAVAAEARKFIDYASQSYYFAPNLYVRRSERSKWRFTAKRLYRSLMECACQPENLERAAELVEELYLLLCKACRVYLFSTDDPFGAIGVSHDEFFRQTLALRNRHMSKDQFIAKALALLPAGDTGSCSSGNLLVVLEFLPLPDSKLRALEAIRQVVNGQLADKNQSQRQGRVRYSDSQDRDRRRCAECIVNTLTRMALHCCAQLSEFNEGVRFFESHYIEASEEVKLYIIVQEIHGHYGQPELVLDLITSAMARGVRPRDELLQLAESIRAVNPATPGRDA